MLAANLSAALTASHAAAMATFMAATLAASLTASWAVRWSVSMLAARSAVALCCAIGLQSRGRGGKGLREWAEVLGSGAGCGWLCSGVKHG